MFSPKYLPASSAEGFQLLRTEDKRGGEEEALFNYQVQQVKEWWESPRYKAIKRPYSPEDVVSKRGSLQQAYPSSLMAKKLFNLLNSSAQAGQPVHTSAPSYVDELNVREERLNLWQWVPSIRFK